MCEPCPYIVCVEGGCVTCSAMTNEIYMKQSKERKQNQTGAEENTLFLQGIDTGH